MAPTSSLPSSLIQTTIKELSSSGALSSLPSLYVFNNPEAAAEPVALEEELIPVIDFSLLTTGTPEQQSQAIQDLGKACEDWGCFTVVNHGVEERVVAAMGKAVAGFFELSEEEKSEYAGEGLEDPVRYGTSYNVSVDEVRYWRDFIRSKVHPVFHSPHKPPGFRDILQEYTSHTRTMARKLLECIWESLQLEKSSMDNTLDLDSCMQIFIGNLYPPCPQPELAIGLPAHTDHGLLTVLFQNGVDGLQIKHNDKWLNVKPQFDSFFINIGDQTEIISNGRFKSVVHRATVNSKSSRISIVTLVGPSKDAIVAPVPQLVCQNGRSARYRGMKYKDYIHLLQTTKIKERSVLNLLQLPTE